MDSLNLFLTCDVLLISLFGDVYHIEFVFGSKIINDQAIKDLKKKFALTNLNARSLKYWLLKRFPTCHLQQQMILGVHWTLVRLSHKSDQQLQKLNKKTFVEACVDLCQQRENYLNADLIKATITDFNNLSLPAILADTTCQKVMLNKQLNSFIKGLSKRDLAYWRRTFKQLCCNHKHDEIPSKYVINGNEIIFVPSRWFDIAHWHLLLIIPQQGTTPDTYKKLTQNEQELCQAMICEQSPAEYAANKNKSIHTVRRQLQGIYKKMDVHNRHQLLQKITYLPTDVELN